MSWLQLIFSIIQFIFAFIDKTAERDREVKKQKQEALGEAKQAIKARDASRVNAAFDRLRDI